MVLEPPRALLRQLPAGHDVFGSSGATGTHADIRVRASGPLTRPDRHGTCPGRSTTEGAPALLSCPKTSDVNQSAVRQFWREELDPSTRQPALCTELAR
jgi:hypothetical protein